jgi:hypothetical protein
MQDNGSPSPFRDTIRERNAVKRAKEILAETEATSRDFTGRDYAACAGLLSVTVADLLAVVANLQAVADHAEGGQS